MYCTKKIGGSSDPRAADVFVGESAGDERAVIDGEEGKSAPHPYIILYFC